MGRTATAERVVLGKGRNSRRALFADPHHPCLGSECALPYSADRGKQSVNRQALDELKQQIPLLDYLQAQDWQPVRPLSGGRWMGLCPLHADRKPSFLVDPGKSLFYCYGCGRGGDVIRFAEIYPPGEVPASFDAAAPMAWPAAVVAASHGLLSHAATPPHGGDCLSAPTRSPLAGTD